MVDPNAAVDDELRRPYRKLFESLEARQHIFTPQQRQHLACWRLWVLLRLQLFTDDSFVFNKVARNVQELMQQLPETNGEDGEAACTHVLVRCAPSLRWP